MSTPAFVLPTVGGALIDIRGTGLGLTSSAVRVAYAGGSDGMMQRLYILPPGACTLVLPGTALRYVGGGSAICLPANNTSAASHCCWLAPIRCISAPGVGANYTLNVTVDGGVSSASSDSISYAPPVINSLSGSGALGASAAGGAEILLTGSNFGPVDATTVVRAWAIPSVNSSLAFPATSCNVTTDHTTITCIVGPGVGAGLTWRLVVEGQSNTVPQSSYATPTLFAARWVEAGVTAAATTGGTLLSIVGVDLGLLMDFVTVTITVPAGDVPIPRPSCTMPRPDVEVVCSLLPGTGAISRIGVSVLGLMTWLAVSGLGYSPPMVTLVSPRAWGTDLASAPMLVTVTGSGFGAPSLSSLVVVGVASVASPGCDASHAAGVVVQNVNVRSDTELVFEVQYSGSISHAVSAWLVTITVSGQSNGADVIVYSRPPSVPILTFDRAPNSTHYFLLLTGTDFGPFVRSDSCEDDVSVTIAGQACATLRMLMVRVGGLDVCGACVCVGGGGVAQPGWNRFAGP